MSLGTAFSAPSHRTGSTTPSSVYAQDGRAQFVADHCAGRIPGFDCLTLNLPGYRVCPTGHALVPYQRSVTPKVIGLPELGQLSISPEDSR